MTSTAGDTLITVSPHPDDETLGVGATLSMLIDSGWVMRNLACSLGHAEDHERRRAELVEAGHRLGFATTEMKPLAPLSHTDELRIAAEQVAVAVTAMIGVRVDTPCRRRISLVASYPSRTGIWQSMRIA